MTTRLHRFTELTRQKFRRQISSLKEKGIVPSGAVAYIGMFADDKLVSGIWKDEENEICYVTAYRHRNKGYMVRLLRAMTRDVKSGKLGMLTASPINPTSEHILEKCGFFDGKRKLKGSKVYE